MSGLETVKFQHFADFLFFLHTIIMTQPTSLTAEIQATLRRAGLKATEGRTAVLSLLAKAKAPLTIQGIQKQLKHKTPDQATLYRMMGLLKNTGTIRQVNLEHPHAHYEYNREHHHHAICGNCGKVVDISACNISRLETEVKRIAKFKTINHHSLEFFGICNSCAK